jgi:hypothetical protein
MARQWSRRRCFPIDPVAPARGATRTACEDADALVISSGLFVDHLLRHDEHAGRQRSPRRQWRRAGAWDWQAERGDDTHQALYHGTRCRLVVRQGPAERFQPELYVLPDDEIGTALQRRIAALQPAYPGIAAEPLGSEWWDALRIGHDAAFAAFTCRFLAHVADPTSLPARERPSLLAKYRVTTGAVELSRAKQADRLAASARTAITHNLKENDNPGVDANRITRISPAASSTLRSNGWAVDTLHPAYEVHRM